MHLLLLLFIIIIIIIIIIISYVPQTNLEDNKYLCFFLVQRNASLENETYVKKKKKTAKKKK